MPKPPVPMNACRLSIITPVLAMDDHARELARCLDHLRSGGLAFDHVVVSPAAEAEILAVFKNSVHVPERAGTRGVFDAVAQGFEFAISRFQPTHLSYINADDLLLPGFSRMIDTCKNDPDAVLTGEVNWIGEAGQVFGPVSVWPFAAFSRTLFECGLPPFTQQGAVFPVSLWVKTGGFDKRYKYIADSVFWHSAFLLDVRRRHFRFPVAGYRLRIGQLSGDRSRVNAESSQWHAGLASGSGAKAGRLLARMLARLYFAPRYFVRISKRQRLRSEKATIAGGFSR